MCLNAGGQKRIDAESETLIPSGGGFDVAGTLNANGKAAGSATQQDAEAGLLVTHALRASGFDASEDGTGRGTPLVPIAFSGKDHGADAGDLAPTLRGMGHSDSHANGGGQIAVAAPSLTATNDPSRSPQFQEVTNQVAAVHAASMAVRRLTPRECERLQGFPDDYTLVPYRNKPAADGPRYKALGNSMAVPVMRWIGERIALVDAEIKC